MNTGSPVLARGVRLHADPARGQTVLLGPERVLVPDDVALAVLRRLDGSMDLDALVRALEADFEAPPGVIRRDTRELLERLTREGWVAWR